jgi:flavodoxin
MMAIGKLGTTSTKNCDHKDAVTEIELQLRGKHGIHSIDIFEANDTDSLTPEQIAQWLEERGA